MYAAWQCQSARSRTPRSVSHCQVRLDCSQPGVGNRAVLINFGCSIFFNKSKYGPLFLRDIRQQNNFWGLRTVLVSPESDSTHCQSMQSRTLQIVSQRGVQIHALLVSAVSLISQISLKKFCSSMAQMGLIYEKISNIL